MSKTFGTSGKITVYKPANLFAPLPSDNEQGLLEALHKTARQTLQRRVLSFYRSQLQQENLDRR